MRSFFGSKFYHVAIAVLGALGIRTAHAGLVHYQPWDENGSASLKNLGTAGGTSTTPQIFEGVGPVASPSTDTPTAFPGYSESFYGDVNVANSASTFRLDDGQDMTISFWMKANGGDLNAEGLVSTLPGNQVTGWGLSLMPDGKLRFNYTNADGGSTRFSATSVTAGSWVPVAMTWKANTGEALKFYINGADTGIAFDNTFTGASLLVPSSQPVQIGTIDGNYLPYVGLLDDVAMFNEVLTAGEVRAISTAPGAFGDYTANDMNSLFTLYTNAAGSTNVDGTLWSYSTTVPTAGHLVGDSWTDGSNSYILLDGAGGGLAASVPEPASISLLVLGGALGLRRKRSR